MTRYFFFFRRGDSDRPAGYTVSKKDTLPAGDFVVTEYTWADALQYCVLWFIDDDAFTAAEREAAKNQHLGV